MLDAEAVAAYLARLVPTGSDGAGPPSAEGLATLHRAHVERVPWETMWIHEGLAWGLEPATSAARIAATGRGGYCYHLNGAFAALLDALGYTVTRHVGGVHGPDGPDAAMLANHLVLLVSGLPTDACPDGVWYVDVGLGDALHGPVPLVAGPVDQPPFALALSAVPASGDRVGDWHLAHDPAGAFVGLSIVAPPTGTDLGAFAERHTWLSSAPESNFVRLLVVQRRTATAVHGLRGLKHTVIGPNGVEASVIEDRTAWLDLLADGFGLVPSDPDPLWDRVLRAHEEREA